MIKPIKTEEEYNITLERIYTLIQKDVEKNTKKGDELELLSILVGEYERKNYPIAPPHPIEAIKFRMEQMGMPLTELSTILGSSRNAILSGKKKLSLAMIRNLHKKLHIPAEVLISEY